MTYPNPDITNVVVNGTGFDVTPTNDPAKDRDNIQYAVDHGTGADPVVLLKAGIFNLGTDAYNIVVPGNRKSVKITKNVVIRGEGASTVVRGGGDQTFDADAAVGADSLADGLARAAIGPNGLYHHFTGGVLNILAGAFVSLSGAKVTVEKMDFEQFLFAGVHVRKCDDFDLKECDFRNGVAQISLVETGGIVTGIWMGRVSTSQLVVPPDPPPFVFDVVDVPTAVAGDILVKECTSDSSHHTTSAVAALTMLAMNAGIEIKECNLTGSLGALSAEIFDTRDPAKTVKLLDNRLYGGIQVRAIEGDYEVADNLVDLRGLPASVFGPFACSHAVTSAGHTGLIRDNQIWSHVGGSGICFQYTANPNFGLRSGGSKGTWIHSNQINGTFGAILAAPNRDVAKPTDGNFYYDNEGTFAAQFQAVFDSQSKNNLVVGLDPAQSIDLGTDDRIVLNEDDLSDAEKATLDLAKAAAAAASPAPALWGFGGQAL